MPMKHSHHHHEEHHHKPSVAGQVSECGQWLQISFTPTPTSAVNVPGFWLIRCQSVASIYYCAADRTLRIDGHNGTLFQMETLPDEAKPIIEVLAAAVAMEARAVR